MYYVDIITKILLLGLLLWTIYSWSDSIVTISILLFNFIQFVFNSMVSIFNKDTNVEPFLNKEL